MSSKSSVYTICCSALFSSYCHLIIDCENCLLLRGILNNVAVDEPMDALEAHDNDVPPPVLYWFGMHQLQKGGKGNSRHELAYWLIFIVLKAHQAFL